MLEQFYYKYVSCSTTITAANFLFRWTERKMKMNMYSSAMLLIFLIGVSNVSHSTTVAVTNGFGGKLTGINGIVIDSEIYNVRFSDVSPLTLFNNGATLDFITNVDALAAAEALNFAYNNLIDQSFTDDPSLTYGIGNNISAYIITPYNVLPNLTYSAALLNYNFQHGDIAIYRSFNTAASTSEDNIVYADWTRVSAVPVPAAIWLMGSGLFGLIAYSRKKA